MDKRVHLLGAKPDVCSYVSSFDVFLLTPLAEGFSDVLGKAMDSGLPFGTALLVIANVLLEVLL